MAGGALLRLLVAVVLLAQLAVLSQFLIAPSTSVHQSNSNCDRHRGRRNSAAAAAANAGHHISAALRQKRCANTRNPRLFRRPSVPERASAAVGKISICRRQAVVLGGQALGAAPALRYHGERTAAPHRRRRPAVRAHVGRDAPLAAGAISRTAVGLRGWRIRREADGFEYAARPGPTACGPFPAVATCRPGLPAAWPWQVGVVTGGCASCCAPFLRRPSPGRRQRRERDPAADDVDDDKGRRNVTRDRPTGGALHRTRVGTTSATAPRRRSTRRW